MPMPILFKTLSNPKLTNNFHKLRKTTGSRLFSINKKSSVRSVIIQILAKQAINRAQVILKPEFIPQTQVTYTYRPMLIKHERTQSSWHLKLTPLPH